MKISLNKKVLIPIVVISMAVLYVSAPYLDCFGRMRLGLSEVVALDGFNLSVMTCGSNETTVIIEPGLNVHKESYYGLQRRIFPHATTITYDHAGIGESTVSNNPRTLPFYVQELKAMLTRMNLEPPYILIGHSLGGHTIRYFTDLYPDEVAGLVFLDHPHEDWFRYIRKNWSTDEQQKYFEWWNPEVISQDQVGLIERLEYDNNNDLVRGKVLPDNIPVLMFTGDNHNHFRSGVAEKSADMHAWATMQFSLVYHVDGAKQIIDWETGHAPHRDKPDEVAREINAFIEKVKQAR